jgi:aminomethyltransferase
MTLQRTPFFEQHKEAGGRLIDFGGWELPVQFDGIIAEHQRVRQQVGLFDVSHMGEVRVRGSRALEAVRHLVTNDLDLTDGQAQYTPMCFPDGGIVDDLIVYRLASDDLLICVNASNREKDFAWMVENNPLPDEVVFEDQGDQWAQIAVQGPLAERTLQALTSTELSVIPGFGVAQGELAGVAGCILARTGYTGEDGFEAFLPLNGAKEIWSAVLEAGSEHGIGPIGLGARDTLRLEAKMCLYGNDIDATTSPLEAALGWTVKLDKESFIGREALLAQRQARVRRRLVCLEVEKRIARHGNDVLVDGQVAGQVTSGTRSPTLGTNIALAYVPRSNARPGSRVQIDIRGRQAEAQVVKGPFYRREH